MKLLGKTEQAKALAMSADRRKMLAQAVTSVVQGFTPALFLWGPPGLGKSYELTGLLDGLLNRRWKHHTAYATPKALMLAIAETPSGVHLFEDCEKMIKTDLSASILRAACGSPNDRERLVTYETANETIRVKFTGGIIIATNENLARQSGPMNGVASRFRPIKWDMEVNERLAMLQMIASFPHVKRGVQISPAEATKVLKEMLQIIDDNDTSVALDLRLFTEHALPAYAQHKADPSGGKWEDLLLAKISGTATTEAESQANRTQRLRALAQRVHQEEKTTKARIARWKALTGLGQAIYYRHLKK